jgi:NAD(P)-dependent dehydrogenase (short-subunit alcohol dehydrogenase family)
MLHDGLRDRVIVVTGGAKGIGRAAVLAAAQRGGSVVIADRDEAGAHEVAREAASAGAAAVLPFTCDVSLESSVQRLVAAAAALGPIWGLVTSAGIDNGGLAHELSLQSWQHVLDVNLTGTFLSCKHALRAMVHHGGGGSIVCVSSPWAHVSAPGGATAYCASKGGVSALVRSLALDYASYGVRVNAIVPGTTETDLMWANVAPADVPAARERIAGQVALRRLAQPSEIGPGIAWLLGDESGYMTGSQLVIDGGLLARGAVDC